jgi:hypothetical protein
LQNEKVGIDKNSAFLRVIIQKLGFFSGDRLAYAWSTFNQILI